MKIFPRCLLAACAAGLLQATAYATNPLIMDQFTADPTARVFEGRIYVYPSHDILASPGQGRPGWFCMEDYHVFSSENLTDWKDHGVIVRQTEVAWADPKAYSMWAPDCVFKKGKYYFYFPAVAKTGGFKIGVALAEKPFGPFLSEPNPIEGVQGIDPCVFLDKDGAAYLYYSKGRIYAAKLKDTLLELDAPAHAVENLPAKGLIEGPFVFERNGIYYLTYPHVENKIERLEYATSDHPLGPFKPTGVILDESPSGCWTVHQSIVEYQGQWYLFYHDKDLSPNFDKNRSIRADFLFFNDDGTIRKVVPTLRGIGVVDAKSKIQIDRYSAISGEGVAVSFLNPADAQEGWKVSLAAATSWVRFDRVDFGKGDQRALTVNAFCATSGAVEVHLDKPDGPLVARVQIAPGSAWEVVRSKAGRIPTGIHDLVVTQTGNNPIELDWISFE